VRHPRDRGCGAWTYAHSEQTLAAGLLGRLDAGVLLLTDRLFAGAATWRQAQASGAARAWPVRTGRGAPRLHPERILADGSWLSRLDPEGRTGQPVVVRVLEYAIDDPGRPTATGQVYRLVTSILDPRRPRQRAGHAVPPALGDRGRPG
jgi:hypothetical protein